ncbi:dihydrofolate reductase family protein [Microbacterium deminutum]|uniref:Bifunctional diaminohydroxyphosphoribosylaminopyrimidine deaminase/5-amino-6-(5-phosphoribosylamino)uracil reductase n=1 Tax=Microbacterium deminutum TaxID=344164 RepID=A0ABN2QFJ1_9MICO
MAPTATDFPAPAAVVTEVVPRTLESVEIGADGTDAWMSARYRPPGERFVRLNLITTITGATSGGDGTSETITSRTDRFVLGAIRRSADVVVVGAETVRVEGYLLPKTARLAVVTTSGDLGVDKLSAAGRDDRPPALVLCPKNRADEVRHALGDAPAEVVPVPSDGDRLRPETLIAVLRAKGLGRVVCEGGPALASQFVDSGVVDEICVTVSPVLEPARHPFVTLSGRLESTVAGMLVDDAGFSYLRLRIRG